MRSSAANPTIRDGRDGPRGLLRHALHLGHDGQAEGRSARPQRHHRPVRNRQVRPRPARRRHLLVHGRPRLGHRHVVRNVRALEQRRHQPRLRGRLRREHLVLDHRQVQGHRLVHGPDRHPHADEGRRRGPEEARPLEPPLHDVRRRAAQPRGRRLERQGARPPLPRQLVAD